ncbi:site-specific integrase [Ruficoccus sp. ZRK36]|uniref:site-specific integrase n=1 Tax=Ruficoccus sp. ZRK36 TaxID=2866311 RepID=UPI001C72F252|nr:site-specific integrase [Ruficoccus sp. ZRK36]QYY34992.1 site-specific integrase [Ruficoccus sp. ZRK36]
MRDSIGKSEIIRSLKTSDYQKASRRYQVYEIEANNLIDSARRKKKQQSQSEQSPIPSLSTEEIQCMVLQWFHELERASEKERDEYIDEDSEIQGNIIDGLQADIAALSDEIGPRSRDKYHSDIGQEETDKLLEQNNVFLSRDSDTYMLLKKQVVRGLIENYERTIRSLGHRGFHPLYEYFRNVDEVTPPPESVRNHKPKSKVTVLALLERYMQEKETSPRTRLQYESHAERFAEYIGQDKSVAEITRDDFVKYRDLLKQVPSNAAKHFPGSTYQQIVQTKKAKELSKLHPRTINKNFETLSMLFRHACEWGWVVRNNAQKLQLSLDSTKITQNGNSFSTDQLTTIFSAPLYTGCIDDERNYSRVGPRVVKRARYWIPLISLYSGMRLNEICQLYLDDLKELDGIHYIMIRKTNDDGLPLADKRLKSKAAIREVPVHPELLELGFIDYVQEQAKKKSTRLFPELRYKNNGYSDDFQKWFNRFLRSVGVKKKAREICFHSFRHTFRDALREAEVFSEHYKRICGWTESDSTASEYGRGVAIATLYRQISKAQYPALDLSHLKR